MYWQFKKHFFVGYLFALFFSNSIYASTPDSTWKAWFVDQINQHPDIVAAKESMNAAISISEGRERPLYNPELESEFEREGKDNNYRIGINQTVDLWNKREARKQGAVFARTAAQQNFQLTLQQKSAEALRALYEWQAAKQQANLAQDQEEQLDTLLKLVEKRLEAGDLGQVDAELTFLGLSQNLNDAAQAQVQLKQAETRLHELLSDWSPEWAKIPKSVLVISNTSPVSDWTDQHPSVIAAKAEWEMLQRAAELARRETKADPTFGINAGKTGEDDVVALTFSIPLNVRNNFSAEARAARQEALSLEAKYRSIRRKQLFAIKAAQATLHEYQKRFERWQTLMQGRGKRSGQLLEKQWRRGDMSTTEYLLALQQRAKGLVAGIELQTQFHLALIDWLLQSGQLNAALIQLKR